MFCSTGLTQKTSLFKARMTVDKQLADFNPLIVLIYSNFSNLFSETSICGIRFKTSSITEWYTYDM